MRTRRLIGSLLATALVGSGALVATTASTAEAATTYATRIISANEGKPVIYDSSYRTQPGVPVFGDSLSMGINVEAFVDGEWKKVYDGSLAVTRMVGSKTTTVGSTTDAAYLYASTKAVGNARYTISYSGYTESGTGNVYAPTSIAGTLKVQRKITTAVESGRKATYHGKISPRAGKAVVQIKKGKHAKWKGFKKVRVSKRGAWSVKATGPRKGAWYYRVLVPAGHGFAASQTVATGIHRIF